MNLRNMTILKNYGLIFSSLFFIFLVNCTQSDKTEVKKDKIIQKQDEISTLKSPFFLNIEIIKSGNIKKIIKESSEDFNLTLNGKQPAYAKLVKAALDGGTAWYKGDGYELVVKKRIMHVGEAAGYLFGPILTFDKSLIDFKDENISNVRFFTSEEMNKFLGKDF